MRPITISAGPYVAASANNIATTQTVAAGGSVILNGALVVNGVAVLAPYGQQQKVLITSAGNDIADSFTIVGTNWANNPITETILGANVGTVTSVLDYQTVTKITSSAATAAAVTVGTGQTGSSGWVKVDEYTLSNMSVQVDVYGTANYTVQTTTDNPNSPSVPIAPSAMQWLSGAASAVNLVGATQTAQAIVAFPITWIRVVLNSGSGSVRMSFLQGNMTF